MITLVIVKNPFSPKDGREIKHIEADSLAQLKEEYKMDGVELLATVNGHSVEGEKTLKDGDFVVIYPAVEKGGGKGGKGILGIVAAIALSVVSFGVGGLVGAGAWGASMASWGVMGYVAAAAVMFLGSSLIGRMTGQKIDNGSSYDNEPTYAWTGIQTMEGQNNPIALTYGLVKSGGQTIGKYTQAENDNDYLFWLVACGEGELEILDVRLNNNDITLYKDVSYELRSGTNDQSIIPFFGDTHFTQSLSYTMSINTWYESSVQGTATEGIIVKIEFPNGLYYVDNGGKMQSNYVKLVIEIKRSGEGWVDYLGEQTISASTNKAVRREFRVDRIAVGEYSVRVKVTAIQHSDSTRSGYQTVWTGVSAIVYDDFVYPCTALIGIKAKATDQLSGSPSLTFKKWRSVVFVWNPYTNQYETKPAYNPAWACYDTIHQCRYLKNVNTGNYEYEVRGASKELMRYDDFKEWADYCTEKNYYVHIEIVTAGEMLDVANEKIAPIGHGRVVRFGTKYGCIFTHPQEPVQMFGMGNIIEGSFREEFMKIADRANCVEVTFTNASADYSRDVIAVYGETYNSDGYAKTAQVTMDGITDFAQAYREGVYQLQCNKLQLRTVSFEAGIDAIACTVGDVVIIAHDVPQWTNSGRVESVNGNRILLPCEVPHPLEAQVLQWRSIDDVLHEHGCSVVSYGNGYTTVEITYQEGEQAIYPEQYDVFSIAESATENKLFTVQSITRAQDFTRQISCIEYNEGVFTEPDNYDGDEHPSIYTVSIVQTGHQTIKVRKYRGLESVEYTETFTETERGWTISVSVEGDAGYVHGNLVINGIEHPTTVPPMALNKNYTITAKESAEGMTVYINGTVAGWWGYVFYEEPSCEHEVYKNNIIGKIVIKDMSTDGLPYWGNSICGNNDPGSWRQYCANATTIDVSDIDMSRKTSIDTCFKGCGYLRTVIGLNSWNLVNVESATSMFGSCGSLIDIGNVSAWQLPSLRNASSMFNGVALQYIDLHDWYTPNLESTREMFAYNTNLEVLDVSGLDTRNTTDMYNTFATNYYNSQAVSAFKYLIIDSVELKLEMKDSNFGRGEVFPSTTKILVPRSKLEDYKAWGYWAERANQFDAIENYNIIRANGRITVIPIGD